MTEMDDETLVAVDAWLDDLASDGEATVFEEYIESQGILLGNGESTASEADDLRALAVL